MGKRINYEHLKKLSESEFTSKEIAILLNRTPEAIDTAMGRLHIKRPRRKRTRLVAELSFKIGIPEAAKKLKCSIAAVYQARHRYLHDKENYGRLTTLHMLPENKKENGLSYTEGKSM